MTGTSRDPCLGGGGGGAVAWRSCLEEPAQLPQTQLMGGPSACWLGHCGRVVCPAGPLTGVRRGRHSSSRQRGLLAACPPLYPSAHGFGTWRERWSFRFRELPILGEDTELLSPVDAQYYGGDTTLLSQNALCLRKGTLPYAGGGPHTNVGDRKRLSTKQYPNKKIFLELEAGESRCPLVLSPFCRGF